MFTTEMQYIVIRYMLNELADEAVNVGMVAVADEPGAPRYRFLPDPTIKSRNDARVKRDAVDRFQAIVEEKVRAAEQDQVARQALLQNIRQLGGNLVRTTEPRSALTNDFEKEFDLLYAQWVTPSRVGKLLATGAPRMMF